MKILNLYSGIGGNRKLWNNCEVTAVELNPKIAEIYKTFFPQDTMVIADAHKILLDHFEEYDFVWTSPPCPTHSRARKLLAMKPWGLQNKPCYPDMKLYEEILLLEGYFKGKYCVENVVSWYDPLIQPKEINNHYFWTNFNIPAMYKESREHDGSIEDLEKRKGFNLSNFNGIDKIKTLRNCVEPETGYVILEAARGNIINKDPEQLSIFNELIVAQKEPEGEILHQPTSAIMPADERPAQ